MTKRIRLRGGKWITKVLPESNPAELASALPDEIWECGDGRKILVKDMETRHIVHVIATLEKRCIVDCVKFSTAPQLLAAATYSIYNKLVEELNKRIAQTVVTPVAPMPTQLDLVPVTEERTRMFSLD